MAKVCIPWTNKTCPLKPGDKLKYIEFSNKYSVEIQKLTENGVICKEIPFLAYFVLRNYFITEDGKPCGNYIEETNGRKKRI